MFTNRPFVLSIAGLDPSAGAGILSDCKTFENLKSYGLAIATANTLQSDTHLFSLQWIDISTVVKSIRTLVTHYDIQVIKIGITPDLDYLQTCLDTLREIKPDAFILWDPVLVSSSGHDFMKLSQVPNLEKVLSNLDLITPNITEIDQLIVSNQTPLDKAKALGAYCAVLLKGGHNTQALGTDYLVHSSTVHVLKPTKTLLAPKHGSGCVLSSAICSYIAQGASLEQACIQGKMYIERFLNSTPYLLGYHD